MGATSSTNMQAELDKLKEEVKASTENEAWLDSAIAQMQTSLRELADDEANAQYAYVTHEDVRSIPAFAPDTVIAIKAPSGTTLEVPDPDEGMEYPQRRYQIYLKSQTGPVEVFLVSQDAEGGETSTDGAVAAGSGAVDALEPPGGSAQKRSRTDAGDGGDVGSPSRRRALGEAGAGGSSASSGLEGGLIKLSPVDESATDIWAANPATQQEMGVADLFLVDGCDPVKVEG